MKPFFFLITVMLFILSCAKPPDLNVVPSLEFIGLSKNSLIQGSINQDSVIITLRLKDGDGDIGYNDIKKRIQDLFVVDKRTGFSYDSYVLPAIPQPGVNNGIIVTMKITLLTTCCIVNPCDPDPDQEDEKLPLEIYIKDRAGNQSNSVIIDELSLICKK